MKSKLNGNQLVYIGIGLVIILLASILISNQRKKEAALLEESILTEISIYETANPIDPATSGVITNRLDQTEESQTKTENSAGSVSDSFLTETTQSPTSSSTSTMIPEDTDPPPTITPSPKSYQPIPTRTEFYLPPPPGLDPVQRNRTYNVLENNKILFAKGLAHNDWYESNSITWDLTLDIYSPDTSSGADRPALVLFHGGGFKDGISTQPELVSLAQYFASRGWVVISANYRVEVHHGSIPEGMTEMPFPPEIYPAGRDAKAAIRWVHANAGKYQISPDHISVLGSSAGAMLAIMIGNSNPSDYRDELTISQDPTLETTNLTARTDVRTVISLWGDDSLLQALAFRDGQNRLSYDDPPLLLIHGTNDTTVPYENAEDLYFTYRNYGLPVEFYPLYDKGHTAWNAKTADGRTIPQIVFDFMVAHQGLLVSD